MKQYRITKRFVDQLGVVFEPQELRYKESDDSYWGIATNGLPDIFHIDSIDGKGADWLEEVEKPVKDKPIERLGGEADMIDMFNKINELIDYINSKEKKNG